MTFIPVWNCPVCDSHPDHHKNFENSIGKYWTGQQVEPLRLFYGICDRCGTVFQLMRLNDAKMRDYYMHGDYRRGIQGNAVVGDRIKTEQQKRAEFLMPHIDLEEVKRALDIGSSTGLLLEALAEKYDCEVLGIEPGEAQRMAAHVVSYSSLDMLDNSYLNTFDLITMIHTLEHLARPTDYLVRLHNFITDDGHLIVEVPHLYHEHTLLTPHPVAFTPESLEVCLNLAGWEVVWLKTYKSYKEQFPGDPNILVKARPGAVVESFPSVDITEVRDQFNAGQAELGKFTQERLNR